ncbi:MAG TPA: hypothetical protein VMI11_00740 [Actinomycetes bacterium]|nr:hypothetical protein [Actinomycetes bacterium]
MFEAVEEISPAELEALVAQGPPDFSDAPYAYPPEEFLTFIGVEPARSVLDARETTGVIPTGVTAFAELAAMDPRLLDGHDRVEYVSAIEAQRAHLDSLLLAGVHALGQPEPATAATAAPDDGVRLELTRLALGSSEQYAGSRILLADALATRLPVTRAMLTEGRIPTIKAAIVVELTGPLSDEECATAEARVFPRGLSQTSASFRRSVRRVVRALRPDLFVERVERAIPHETRVTCWDDDTGFSRMMLTGPTAVVRPIVQAVRDEARAQHAAATRAGQPRQPIGMRELAALWRWATTAHLDRHAAGPQEGTDVGSCRTCCANLLAGQRPVSRWVCGPSRRRMARRRPARPAAQRARAGPLLRVPNHRRSSRTPARLGAHARRPSSR